VRYLFPFIGSPLRDIIDESKHRFHSGWGRDMPGLNRNHNHDLKNLFESAATVAAVKAGPFQEFYDALLAKGIKPEMARLTLARKMAAITLLVWKKGVRFDANYLKPQTA
jgi:hypothetical protein